MLRPTPTKTKELPGWFSEARLGMFIHYDHASQLGLDLSWPIVGLTSDNGTGTQSSATVDYYAAMNDFDPARWDPADLAARARRAGMRYAVFTTRHHSGWASWPSRHARLTIASSPYGARGGDLVREFTEAFRAEGLRIGLYFSLSDWGDPDYPAWTPAFAPYSFETYPRPAPDAWQRYLARMRGMLTELLSNYGQIDLLWFDGGWERSAAEWDAAGIESLVRSLQPDIVINDRLPGVGDYTTPEQAVPAGSSTGPWELCLTLNDTWGWVPQDHHYRSAGAIVRTLSQVAAGGGNLLLNVGPDRDGALPAPEARLLEDIAAWLQRHGGAVFDTSPGLEPWQFYGPSTRSTDGRYLYLHLPAWPDETVAVRGIHPRRVLGAELLTTGEELSFVREIDPAQARTEDPVGSIVIEVPAARPATLMPVIKLSLGDASEATGTPSS